MSELLLPRLKREIEARLAELRPLIAEVAQLEAAKRALLDDSASSPVRWTPRASREPVRERAVPPPPEPGSYGVPTPAPVPDVAVSPAAVPDREPEPEPERREPAPARAPLRGRSAPLNREPLLPPRESLARTTRVPEPKQEEANGDGAPTISDMIVAIVDERPGVSIAEIVAVTKIAKPTVATTVSKLKRDGVLADEAGGVKLASRQPLTLSQIAAAATRKDAASEAEWDAAGPPRRKGAAA